MGVQVMKSWMVGVLYESGLGGDNEKVVEASMAQGSTGFTIAVRKCAGDYSTSLISDAGEHFFGTFSIHRVGLLLHL